jgi:hypothetical protein
LYMYTYVWLVYVHICLVCICTHMFGLYMYTYVCFLCFDIYVHNMQKKKITAEGTGSPAHDEFIPAHTNCAIYVHNIQKKTFPQEAQARLHMTSSYQRILRYICA